MDKLDKKIDDIKEKQGEIHIQVTKTNGRVNKLEDRGKMVWIGFTFLTASILSVVAIIWK